MTISHNTLDTDFAAGIFDAQTPPCLSLYQPTHRSYPENQQDPIRFRNLIKELEESLRKKYASWEVKAILSQFRALSSNSKFWNHSGDGLVVLGSPDLFRAYQLQRPVTELAVVADSFHIKPLLRILQSADRYHILCLNRHDVKLYEGNRDVLDLVEFPTEIKEILVESEAELRKQKHVEVTTSGVGSAPGVRGGQGADTDSVKRDAERFFRAVDRVILEHYSRPTGLPLALVALPEHHTPFHRSSRNPFLLERGIEINPETLSIDSLRKKAWNIVEPNYMARLAGMISLFQTAKSKDLGDSNLERVIGAAAAGRVATILIEADRQIPGCIKSVSGDVEFRDLKDPDVDDLLDDLAELVLRTGGQVVVVPQEMMPTDTGLAAIYRF